MRVLILGGTGEARRLADEVGREPDWEPVSSLAGRVSTPLLPVGEVRIGGFGGAAGLAGWLRAERVDALVDATHPFAATITVSAVAAATEAGVPLVVLRRPGWRPVEGDRWRRVPDLGAAADLVARRDRRVFLTTGRGGLAGFAGCDGSWFLIRTVEPPDPPLPRHHRLLLARGPFTEAGERALLREHRIELLVSKDSGGEMTSAKLAAARELGVPVVLVDRPPPPPGVTLVGTVAEALGWLTARGRAG